MQKITPLGRWTEEIYQICLCCEHYWQFPKNPEGQDLGEWLDSFVLLAYTRFAASRTLLQRLLTCLNFILDSEDLFCLLKRKKWFLWIITAENHEDEWSLTWCLRSRIYTSIQTWTHSQNSLAAAEAVSLEISSNGTSLKWSRRPYQSAQEWS